MYRFTSFYLFVVEKLTVLKDKLRKAREEALALKKIESNKQKEVQREIRNGKRRERYKLQIIEKNKPVEICKPNTRQSSPSVSNSPSASQEPPNLNLVTPKFIDKFRPNPRQSYPSVCNPPVVFQDKQPSDIEILTTPRRLKNPKKKRVSINGKNSSSTKTVEERRKYEREKKRKQRAKMTQEDLEKRRKKDRERLEEKRQKGLIQGIGELSSRRQRILRKQWAKNSKRYREKQRLLTNAHRFVDANTPPESPRIDQRRLEHHSIPVNSGKSKLYKKIAKLKNELAKERKNVQKYKKQVDRLRVKKASQTAERNSDVRNGSNNIPSPSPNKTVDQMLQGHKVPAAVRKKLLFTECLIKQVKERKKNNSAMKHCEVKAIRSIVGGTYVKKYKILNIASEVATFKNRSKCKASISTEEKEKVKLFLEEDIHSRCAAGKKECITKYGIKKQKRYLLDSLKNLYKKYCETCTKEKRISYTTFCRLRPFWIVSPKITDRDTCACKRHENFNFILNKLYLMNFILFKNTQLLCSEVCCDVNNKNCMLRICEACKNKKIEPKSASILNINVKYFQWQSITEKIKIKNEIKEVRKTRKIAKSDTVDALITHINKELPEFLKHVLTINHQYVKIKALKQKLSPTEILIQVDFSENYNLKLNTEIQSMHFGASKEQLSLHTGIIFFANKRVQSFCTVSNNLSHNAFAIWAHLAPVLEYVKEKTPEVKRIHFLSDGPSAQYKNRSNFYLMIRQVKKVFPEAEFLSWNFSAAGHGKGPMDGVGAVVKRTADKAVAQYADLTNIEDFTALIQKNCPGVLMYQITSEAIETMRASVPNNIPPIKDVMKTHQVTVDLDSSERCLSLRSLSCFECSAQYCLHHNLGKKTSAASSQFPPYFTKEQNVDTRLIHYNPPRTSSCNLAVEDSAKSPTNSTIINVGTWVAVQYGDMWYPGNRFKFVLNFLIHSCFYLFLGTVVSRNETGVLTVKFLKRFGKNFVWPVKPDIQSVNETDILSKIDVPKPVSSKREGLFFVSLAEEEALLTLLDH